MALAEKRQPVTALGLADEFRHGRSTCRPIQLWRLAQSEAHGHIGERLARFRHSMLHAGYLLNSKGKPYKRCPMCRSSLPS